MKKLLYFLLPVGSLWLTSCSVNKQIAKQAKQTIFSDSNFAPAHVGISIYDPSTNTYLYNYQGDKYFVPASNTKLFTCYAAMKNLGDSLVGAYVYENDSNINVIAAGDPTFLQKDFSKQPLFNLLNSLKNKKINILTINGLIGKKFIEQENFKPLGRGWAWDDFSSDYMAERSVFPIYGNVVTYKLPGTKSLPECIPSMFMDSTKGMGDCATIFGLQVKESGGFDVERISKETNRFYIWPDKNKKDKEVPFATSNKNEIVGILKHALKNDKIEHHFLSPDDADIKKYLPIHSQPTDSLLKITMHRSDNFFAEQTLLMVSNEKLGVMNDREIIDTLLNTDFKGIPQKPKWVDGSGLSRYNLITPQDFVWVLTQMKNNFKWERIATILPTGNEGTLAGYYKNYVGKIYAKTGTLSNNVALSGFITTKKGKQLIFSVLVNNHQTSASNIRRTIEKFLTEVMEKY